MFARKALIVIVALLLGILIVSQIKSFAEINNLFIRDTQTNVFQEIMILKSKNEDLRGEIDQLNTTLEQLDDRNSALEAIEDEIMKYKKLTGEYSVFGAGVTINIDANLTTPWIIDLVNELFNSGAQAVSINGIRLINQTVGFDTLPQGQILLNGVILSSPYVIETIGEPSLILDILELPGGILDRLEAAFPEIIIGTESKEIIQMDKI